MCWSLLPQSICIGCSLPVHFPIIQTPCPAVASHGLPFAACGNSPFYTAVEGPEGVTCETCFVARFPEAQIPDYVRRRSDRVYRVPRAASQPVYNQSPAVPGVPGVPALVEAPTRPSSSNLMRPPPVSNLQHPPPVPAAGSASYAPSINNYNAARPAAISGRPSTQSGGRSSVQSRGGRGGPSRMQYGLQPSPRVANRASPAAMALAPTTSVPAAAPVAPQGHGHVTYAAPPTRGNYSQQLVPRPCTPMPARRRYVPTTTQSSGYDDEDDEGPYYDEEEEEDDDNEEENSGSGSGSTNTVSSYFYSNWSASDPPTGPRLTLPGADSPFGWGYTAPRRNPANTPVAVSNFLNDYLASPTTYAPPASSLLPPPPIPSARYDDAAWVPPSWGAAVPMPAELALDLDTITADCVFRQHRVYFVPDLWEGEGEGEGEGDASTVLVITPCGLKVHVLSYELYLSTSAEINRLAREAEVQAQRAEKRRRKEERKRRKMGLCIYHPCRVASCPCDHEAGQHQPLNIGHFFKANRRLSEGEKADQQQQQQQRRRSSIKSPGKGKDKEVRFEDDVDEQPRGRSPTRRSSPPPGVSLQPTTHVEDEELETPSTLHLSPVKTTNRAPKRLVEKDGGVKSRPFKDLTRHSDGSPSPPKQRRVIQSAQDAATPSENTTQDTASPMEGAFQKSSQGATVAGSSREDQSEVCSGSKARAKLGKRLDMSDLRIGDDEDDIF